MAWVTKTLVEQVTAAERALTGNLSGADAALARNNLRPVAQMFGGGMFELSRFLAWAADQRFILTSDDDQLDRHGAEMKPPVRRKRAAPARGVVTLTATGAVTLATGALLTRSDGVAFRVDAGVVLAGAGSLAISVTAATPGALTSTPAGAVLGADDGLTGPAIFAVAAGGLGGGADDEEDGPYRSRLLFAKAFPEHAGAPPDWLRYTLAVPGVTRAFIEPLGHGRGTVVVYPFFDETRPNGIGLESDRLAVEQALRLSGPGAALPVVRLPVPVAVDYAISGLAPATPETRQAVVAEVANAFFMLSRVAGIAEPHPSMPFLASPESFSRSWIWQAIANASGEQRHELATPADDIALATGETAVPGAPSFL